ncbi:DNA-processing protein DprA [Haliea sp. E1-2-M8]|uniref:DNA-processing protein DprA n=1 Tax=Haliea sp. E1-2-M8 TaxID=3064706 RepID=UPI002727820D|nr:DNA-processing protein DprA [Haliea sp. E1-2-M8]MDO8860071.1 DNA-processing protein DprA [Haliea sp. E1-2-M8]
MDAAHARLCLLLHSLPRLEKSQLRRLLQHFGSPEALWQAEPRALGEAGAGAGARADLATARRRGRHPDAPRDIDRQVDALLAVDGRVIALGAPDYPLLLAAIHDPPPLLYLRGNAGLLQAPQLAMVGSRKASPPGIRFAQELAAAAVRVGLAVTSGLALGIDGAAHRGALEAGGTSVAVMATGVDTIYPRRHDGLARQLLEKGCLVSEFAPLTPALPEHFPARNRIISGLALGVLVVEAAVPSGSLITAGTALEQGREVFAVPWFPGHAGGRGCLRLLRDGAAMVESIDDILAELGALFQCQLELAPAPRETTAAGTSRSWLLPLVGFEVVTVEALVAASGRTVAEVLAALSSLELERSIVRHGGGYIRR